MSGHSNVATTATYLKGLGADEAFEKVASREWPGGCVVNPAVEHCQCSHPKGDHQSSRARGLTVKFGRCLTPGCDCTVFTVRVDDEREVPHAA